MNCFRLLSSPTATAVKLSSLENGDRDADADLILPAIFNRLHFRALRQDFLAGLTTAVVALPMSLAFGVASGLGALAGIYGAVFCGFFAAMFGGTQGQATGPTGPLTVVIASLVAATQSLEMAFASIILAGAMQIAIGLLGLGKLVQLVPRAVTSGFMTGVGTLIVLLQSAPVLGAPGVASAVAGLKALPANLAHADPVALSLGLASFGICRFTPRHVAEVVPAPLIALILTTAAAALLFPGAATVGAIPMGLPSVHLPALAHLTSPGALAAIAPYAAVLAVLGSIDALLTSLVADAVTHVYHDPRRELVGQGLGNMFSGLFGGLIGAGATMLTVVNIRSGAQTCLSGAFYAAVMAGAVLCLSGVVSLVPLATLAGIVLSAGLAVVDWEFLSQITHLPVEAALVGGLTWYLTVFVDLILAVGAGCALAMFMGVLRSREAQLDSCTVGRDADGTPVFGLSGNVDFSGAGSLTRALTPVVMREGKGNGKVVLDLRGVTSLDSSAMLAVTELVHSAEAKGIATLVRVGQGSALDSSLRGLGLATVVA